MDMKFGIAANLEILREACDTPSAFSGNILFLSVPDEEANSAGMLAATDFLLSLKQDKQLTYSGCLVSEPFFPKFPGDTAKYIYTGTVGKLLPVFYCVGKETHVCEPFSGLNPNLLAAKIVEKLELNPGFSDSAAGSFVPPPVCLKQSDTKAEYSVQSPAAAYAYFNYMTLWQTPQDVMACLLSLAEDSFAEVLAQRREKASAYASKTGESINLPEWGPKAVSYQELYRLCKQEHGSKFEDHLREFAKNLVSGGDTDLRSLSVKLVEETLKFSPLREPMIVVFFAPPFYPHSDCLPADSAVGKVCCGIVEQARELYGEELNIEPFYPGLSDMSYLCLSDRVDVDGLKANFPLWDTGYQVPLSTIRQLNIPFLCFGPFGKDAHKFTERLNLPYSLNRALPLLREAVRLLLV